ncbi:MAG: hypothetical protein B9S32_06185 [Verrucomicrobia bacterium Tous-C9LFEB]|nr:MAG: hypothetical protein B9S32_06185 [Verrucomicrobia bacterium Tous-C9LFEB]
MSDPALDSAAMGRLAAGDDLALNELMTRWQQPLANFIFRYTGNEAESIDLAQETFVRVYESRDRFKSGSKFSTWLFTIAINLCRNQARWKSRHPTAELDDAIPDSTPTPHDNAVREETAARVRRAIAELPHDLRVALVLYEYEDQSYAEIAEQLDCTVKAVETRLYRAKQLLRTALT